MKTDTVANRVEKLMKPGRELTAQQVADWLQCSSSAARRMLEDGVKSGVYARCKGAFERQRKYWRRVDR